MGKFLDVELVPVKELYYNNSFGIYAAESEDLHIRMNKYGNFTIKGKMQRLNLDVTYKAQIEGVDDPKYGFGYNVHSIYQEIPQTAEGQKEYLSTVMTELQLEEVYKAYPNDDIIELIKTDKFDYSKVKGFGKVTYGRLKEKVMETLEWQNLLSAFAKYGLKYETLKKLVDYFGSHELVMQNVNENPYCITAVSGIGFKKADVIARNMGIELDNPYRIRCGIEYIIAEEQNFGHTYIEREELLQKGYEILQVDRDKIDKEIENTDEVYILDTKIALQKIYNAESYIAEKLKTILDDSSELDLDIDSFLKSQDDKGIQLTPQQRKFFYNFKKYNINFLVGYAGCGKSYLQKLLIDLIKNHGGNLTYRLLAPTGKAAKVLSSYVNDQSASTIHKAIGYGASKEEYGDIEISEDIIIIDEVSMLDVQLASATLKKIKNPRARIVFIGDDFQIPSVGCGNFLRNCLDSEVFPVTKLDKVFRQSEGGILDIATKIRNGQHFLSDDFQGELKFGNDTIVRSVQQEYMESGYKHYYNQLLKLFDSENIMVLSPTKKGNLGTVKVNKNIQSLVNGKAGDAKEIVYHDDCTFRVGDYVINTKNSYDRKDVDGKSVEIVNGDVGVIVDIKKNDGKNTLGKDDDSGIYVKFDFGTVRILFDEMDQLLHAWCLTMHKSQGSAANGVLIIMDKAHKFQLNANLVYTAITRCRNKLIILCQADVINHAMRKFENMKRRTFLYDLLTVK